MADGNWPGIPPAGRWHAAFARRRFLILASEAEIQYRVLRCAASLGAEIHVAGPSRARPLALSRFCAKFHRAPDFAEISEAESVDVVDDIARRHRIDLVLPSDTPTTRLLTRIGSRLAVQTFPVPSAEAFEELATKDRFMRLCRLYGIPHPEGTLFADRPALLAAISGGRIRFPAIFKPINAAGGAGVIRVDAHDAFGIAAGIAYAPILVQDFIAGEDRSVSLFCRGGAVVKEVVYSHPHGVFRFHDEPELVRLVHGLAGEMRLDGVINFDARIGRDGSVWLIECNPRFFFSMDAIMVAGINFVEAEGVVRLVDTSREVKLPRATLKSFLRLRMPEADDWRMLEHWLGDPLMLAFAMSGLQKR